jgi:pre-mRNA cleavage complex 2 protein Pcf11
MITKLYGTKPNTCATCGRRFENTLEGKQKKARHMDWHFKVKDPDAAKRGVHRSWYISEKVNGSQLASPGLKANKY